MDNIAFHITDIAANSIRANASDIEIDIQIRNTLICIRIADNGCGMDPETVSKIRSPFYTTRTTRKIGLGLPFLIQNAEQTGGNVEISSIQGKGTVIVARFVSSHIDCPPWGDLAGTMAMLIGSNPDINIRFSYHADKVSLDISTQELKEILEDMPLSHPKVMLYLKEFIANQIVTSS
ncbi:sensor histidine kinase [uncultured Parabacteroides sp.]|uniref:ATP-binding protein n=1 Tax=uncultured Parabacteroides sp. TaxID=512312 RepID=UPI002639852E|nr:sensor histidine kinase [uncultured Parabacteroides sp.]